jgi:hypothetical protein
LTYHRTSDRSESLPPNRGESVGDGAPGAKIEITLEMIEAGLYELLRYNQDYDSDREAVIRIWKAMQLAA